jgi:hypothetical protein
MNNPNSHAQISTPLKALWQWLMDKPGHPRITPATQPSRALANTQSRAFIAGAGIPLRYPPKPRALRVVRVLDADLPPSTAGRLRISGRMSDVCAELDRLAAYEARLH